MAEIQTKVLKIIKLVEACCSFGYDGNGGKMLKIITDLSDEEMARLKYVRRLAWSWKGEAEKLEITE